MSCHQDKNYQVWYVLRKNLRFTNHFYATREEKCHVGQIYFFYYYHDLQYLICGFSCGMK